MTQKIHKFSSLTLRDGISFVEHLELNQMASPCGPIDTQQDAAGYSNKSKGPTSKHDSQAPRTQNYSCSTTETSSWEEEQVSAMAGRV